MFGKFGTSLDLKETATKDSSSDDDEKRDVKKEEDSKGEAIESITSSIPVLTDRLLTIRLESNYKTKQWTVAGFDAHFSVLPLVPATVVEKLTGVKGFGSDS